MIPDRVLDLAVARGLISQGQALALRSLARQEADDAAPPRPEPVDEERLRFVSGFADIFVTLGLALFLGAGAWLVHASFGRTGTCLALAAAAWALAEFFTRRKRMALPSIVLLLVFVFGVFTALSALAGAGPGIPPTALGWLGTFVRLPRDPLPGIAAAIGTALAAAAHYWRFRVPITVAAVIGALVLTVLYALAAAAPDLFGPWGSALVGACGLAVFALAMWFDLADPARRRRSTDIAFWLHLLAAPLIVHSVFHAITAGRGSVEAETAAGVLLVFVALAVVALLIDRRALLVSALVYAGIAFGSLIRQAGLTDSLPVTLLCLGALVLLISAGWTPLRHLLLRAVPAGARERLPRPLAS